MAETKDVQQDSSSKRAGAEQAATQRTGSGPRADGRSEYTVASGEAWRRVQDALAESMKRAAERKTWTTSST